METEPEIQPDDERYKAGKIYKLQLGNKVYVGSTILTLRIRFNCHKKEKNTCSSAALFKDNLEPAVGLIEKFPCAGRAELCQRERHWQEILSLDPNFVLVNKQQAFTSDEERREHLLELNRKQYESNRQHLLELSHKRYEANRQAILTHNSEKVTCKFCNRQSRRGNILRHQRTAKCKKFQNNS